ncbi:MAG: hypothetical protein CMB00_06885 [Euryarchaeota archaeon]|nr:hypothetical protein [Euryarchaeota archaeon]
MNPVRDLDGAQAQEIEEQLFTTHRQQLPRHVPIPLPRQDFWEMVRALLSSLDLEIQEMVRKGSIDMRLQNLQKRQTNIRRIASELARKRMVAMMQHAASQALRSGVNPNMAHELPSLDWQRHDPSEKAFYHALQLNVDRFKKEIDWQGMQQGLLGEIMMQPRTHAPGTMQLDAYVGEGKITSRPPPDLAFEDTMEPLPATQEDAEERWMDDAPWADEEAYLLADMQGQADTDGASTAATEPVAPSAAKHGAAMELAPSKEPIQTIQDEPPTAAAEPAETPAPQDEDNVRVRILETMPEPVMDASGEPLVLEVGDVHFLDEGVAAWLIDAGVAERAEL